MAFLLAMGYLVAASLTRRSQPTFEPSPIAPRAVPPKGVVDTLTVDARDTERWRFVDFDRRSVVLPPDTAGWDVAVRRFHVMAADAAADLGAVPFDSAIGPPRDGFVSNRMTRDTVNPAVERWYHYSFVSHLLEPKGHVYAVRTAEARYAKIEILSYYCPGLIAGCLTMRYAYPWNDMGNGE